MSLSLMTMNFYGVGSFPHFEWRCSVMCGTDLNSFNDVLVYYTTSYIFGGSNKG